MLEPLIVDIVNGKIPDGIPVLPSAGIPSVRIFLQGVRINNYSSVISIMQSMELRIKDERHKYIALSGRFRFKPRLPLRCKIKNIWKKNSRAIDGDSFAHIRGYKAT